MQRACAIAVLALLGCGTQESVVEAQSTRVVVQSSGGESNQAGWIQGSPVRTQVQVGANGETYVGVWIDAPNQAPGAVAQVRPPMALSLVVDTSGSMSGAKIQNARMAAASLLETLADGDIVSLYAFSNALDLVCQITSQRDTLHPGHCL